MSFEGLAARSGIVIHMPGAVAGRAKRTLPEPYVSISGSVSPAAKLRAQRISDALHISLASYLEQLLLRDVVDENYLPAWADTPLPIQDRLPTAADIKAAA